jgi:hypothetical protein
MPVNELIARGVAPIGQDLPQIAGMIQGNRQRNALMDMQREQMQYNRGRDQAADAAKAAELKQNHTREQLGYAFFVAAKDPDVSRGAELLEEIGLDPSIIEGAEEGQVREIYAELGKKLAGVGGQEKGPGQLYKVGPSGTYATADKAIGQDAYSEPKAPPGPGQLYQVVGPDGKPRYVTAEEARGQQPFNKSEKPPVVADPALQAQDAGNVLAAIKTARDLIGANTTGFIGQKLGGVGGTEAYNLRAALDTVKSSIGFDRLQRMREESKTGGALGQVAVRELELLQATIASIDANQSGAQLRSNLGRVEKQYQRAMGAYQKAMQEQSGQSQGGWSIERVP